MSKVSKELSTALDELKNETKTHLKEFREWMDRDTRSERRVNKPSVKFTDVKYDKMRVKLKSMLEQNKQLWPNNITLNEPRDQHETKLKASDSRLVYSEQKSGNTNVEIKAIQVRDNEKLFATLNKLAKCIKEPISPCDVDVCYRVPVATPQTSKNIIVQLNHRHNCNAVFEPQKKKRLTCAQLVFNHFSAIFVNEHLLPERKRLLGQAMAKNREAGGNLYGSAKEAYMLACSRKTKH